MPTYLFCVLAPAGAEAVPAGLTGIGGTPIRALTAPAPASLEAWVSTITEDALRVSGRDLTAQALLHNEVVNAALALGRTPAPARYGSRFPDDAACVADLTQRAGELRAILDHVAGAVEIPTLLVPRELAAPANERPKPGDPAAGRRYLESLRTRALDADRRRSAAEREASRLRASVGDLVRDEARSFTAAGVMSIAHLVPMAAMGRYRDAVATFVPAEDFRVVAGEPRAPYSFSSPLRSDRSGHDSGSPSHNG
jgi:hypothetical protein